MYVVLSDGVNYGISATANVTNIEKNAPSVEISLSSTETTTEGAITATVVQSDNQSGVNIGSCRWVYNTIAGNIGTNPSSYTGAFTSTTQNLMLSTTTVGTYYLHVLSVDNVGNVVETIKGPIVVRTIKNVVPGETEHTSNEIPYSWTELSTIAKLISKNNNITNDTAEVSLILNDETTKTLGVGDTATLDGKTVRILGFNHDPLTIDSAYGEPTSTGKAGISFEYVDFVTYLQMNSSATNSGGWAATELRITLNRTVYNSLSIKNYIKEVNKKYLAEWSSETESVCSDKLWLLSCGEIWDNGYNGGNTRGYSRNTEGTQYKYYKITLRSTPYSSSTDVLKKPKISTSTSATRYWWLRSPDYGYIGGFCGVSDSGNCYKIYVTDINAIAPGFSI